MNKKSVNDFLTKDMDRKTFMQQVGKMLIAIIGVTSVMKVMTQPNKALALEVDDPVTLSTDQTITGAKIFGTAGATGKLLIAGDTSGTTTLNAEADASGTLTLPAADDTLIGRSTTDTLANKTLDNSTKLTVKDTNLTIQNADDPTKQAQFITDEISTDNTRAFTLPDANTALLGTDTTQQLSNKTISGSDNTLNVRLDQVDVSGILPLVKGGTGATTANGVRTNLGLVVGNDIQAHSPVLDNWSSLSPAANKLPYFDNQSNLSITDLSSFGRNWLANADATAARNSLGVGSMATQNSNSVSITGGSISGISALAVNSGGTGASTSVAARGASGLNIEHRVTFSNADYTAGATDRYIAQTGALTASRKVTIPAANAVSPGYEIMIKDESGSVSSTKKISIVRSSTNTIDGLTSFDITTAYGFAQLRSDGVDSWHLVSRSTEGIELSALPAAASLDADDTIIALEDGVAVRALPTQMTQLAALNGRAGGQTLAGGTGIAEKLVLKGSTNNAPGPVEVRSPVGGRTVFSIASTTNNDDPTENLTQAMINTTDATAKALIGPGPFQPANNSCLGLEAYVMARRTGGTAGVAGDCAFFILYGLFKNDNGVVTQVGTSMTDVVFKSQSTWNATFNISASNIRVVVTGAAGNNITWHTTIRWWPLSV